MLRRRKHGTTGRLALPHQHRRKGEIAGTVRSAPGRDPRMARFIRILRAVASAGYSRGNRRAGRWILTNLFVCHTNNATERASWLASPSEGPSNPAPRCRSAIRSTPLAPCVPPGARRARSCSTAQAAYSENAALPELRSPTSRLRRTRFRARSPTTSAPRKHCLSKLPAGTCCMWRVRPNGPRSKRIRRATTRARWSRA